MSAITFSEEMGGDVENWAEVIILFHLISYNTNCSHNLYIKMRICEILSVEKSLECDVWDIDTLYEVDGTKIVNETQTATQIIGFLQIFL